MKIKSIRSYSLFFIIVVLSFAKISLCENKSIKKNVDGENREDTSQGNDVGNEIEEWMGLSVDGATKIPCPSEKTQMHEIRKAHEKEFPFAAALMSDKNEYLCSGTVVSNGLVLTTAKCLQLPVSYVLLNAIKDKQEGSSKLVKVVETEKYLDAGLVFTEHFDRSVASKITISNFTNAKKLVDVEGIGFGLNADGRQQQDLQSVGMEARSLSGDVLSAYFDCVETKEPLCYKDQGGPVIFNNELVGIVLRGQDICLKEVSATYAINKKMVDILPAYTFKAWAEEKIAKNEEKFHDRLPVFPSKPVR